MSFYEMKFRAWETSARCPLFQCVSYGQYSLLSQKRACVGDSSARLLDVAVSKVGLQCHGIVPLLSRAHPQAYRSMCGCAFNNSLAAVPVRPPSGKPAVVDVSD
jgi:hypothetical protein